ncbi:RnfABCDGE type electron transport complex subunit D [Pontiella sulfatireligans]|uniref:Ion-translocating oxidoreductase complex subunit D n=1 Tax=Pontiella sulfatireligans TaxID=2750658 RepID=A0A6C2URQ6_9BACT|nr:RnfABCDGE type electron transport complex subunit D [Pontiella sulfatireligans]VGO23012.1 Electron transport complex subunit RsxD [Pontiella sulfatireligans]
MSDTENTPTIQMPDPAKLIVSNSPHIHSGQNIPKIMFTVVAALMPACIAAVLFFGLAAIEVLLLCTVSCVVIEEGWNKLVKRHPTWKDGSAIITGILLGMNLNAGTPWWVCILGGFLAIILGKQLYGGLGYNPFNPVLVARVGLLIGFPEIMTTWDKPELGLMKIDAMTAATPLGLAPGETFFSDVLLGNIGGCLGETSAIALLIGGVILLAFKLIKWEVPLAFLGSVFVITGIAHVVSPETVHSPFIHIFTGGLLLGAFFMATDMVTSPMTRKGALIFGLGCGVITSVIRLWGSYPEGVSFAILFMNALTPLIDRATIKKPFGYIAPAKGEAA